MRKLVASINITLDGYCNHTAMIADDELHEHYNEQMRNTGTLLFGRITYQLMEEAWPPLVSHPSGNKSEDEFAVLIDSIPKVVFSKTLTNVHWKNTTHAKGDLKEEVLKLKQRPGKDIVVGSPSLIAQLTPTDLIDEYRLCVHPIVLGSGLVLFKNIKNRIRLKLTQIKKFDSGVVVLSYERIDKVK